ncbi:MAG: hypothetical protein FWG02_11465 [Holophagaceae bacterium]|nr:hypothetical protein [Holophagaceae bacterium]
MDRNEYIFYSSEINTLEAILKGIPEENVIERMGIESRLHKAKAAIKDIPIPPPSNRMKLTFRGEPVKGSYGADSEFLGLALEKFAKAVSAVSASLTGKLNDSGPFPNKQQSQLLVVGKALGSFGFELEVPDIQENTLIKEPHPATESIKKIQEIFQTIADGSDDGLSKLSDEIHPRAIDKVYDFLEYQLQNKALCCVDFGGHYFRFRNEAQLKTSVACLAKDNRSEKDMSLTGTLIGVLSMACRFELEIADGEIKKGKTYLTPEEGKDLLKFAGKTVNATLKEIRVGRGKPSYIIESLDNVSLLNNAESH